MGTPLILRRVFDQTPGSVLLQHYRAIPVQPPGPRLGCKGRFMNRPYRDTLTFTAEVSPALLFFDIPRPPASALGGLHSQRGKFNAFSWSCFESNTLPNIHWRRKMATVMALSW